jgi:hypothetical protein
MLGSLPFTLNVKFLAHPSRNKHPFKYFQLTPRLLGSNPTRNIKLNYFMNIDRARVRDSSGYTNNLIPKT